MCACLSSVSRTDASSTVSNPVTVCETYVTAGGTYPNVGERACFYIQYILFWCHILYMSIVEPIATTCNITSNAIVMRALCTHPDSPVPRTALCLQICGNVAWVSYAVHTRDQYLFLTALTSLALQVTSLTLRIPIRQETQSPIFGSSTESLPSFAPFARDETRACNDHRHTSSNEMPVRVHSR